MICRKIAATIAVALAMTMPAHAMSLSEDFSDGLSNWTVVNPGSNGIGGQAGGASLSVPTDGGPGGTGDAFLRTVDARGGYSQLIFGDGWSGDLSGLNGGVFSMDYAQFSGSGRHVSTFGRLRVSNGMLTAVADIIPNAPTPLWQRAEIDFTAQTFGVSEALWGSILSNVTEVRFQNESVFGVNEVLGYDNVSLAPVPLPAGGVLLLGALGVLGLRRMRQNQHPA